MNTGVNTDKYAAFSGSSSDTAAMSHATQQVTDHTVPTLGRNQNSAECWSNLTTTRD